MSNLLEYIVTLENFNDSEEFYNDMETLGGNFYIPDRCIEVVDRRPISRNTHYMLSSDEAELLKNDPRVLAVDLTAEQLGIKIEHCITETTSSWNKSNIIDPTHKIGGW